MIVGGGPSAKDAPLDQVKGRARILAVNDAWRLCPFADALYACDGAWWRHHNGAEGFTGLKLSQDAGAVRAFKDVYRVELVRRCAALLVARPAVIASGSAHGGGNSGFQALNLAVQFGARRIILVGFDMRLDRGLHWFGHHPRGLNNPSDVLVIAWRKALDARAAQLAALGVEVLNASPVSALTAFPKVDLLQALQ